jgi:ribose transport system ATP-binding protein
MAEERRSLRVERLALLPGRQAFDTVIAPGEIVGLAGLEGHGQVAFLEILAGLRRPASGSVRLGNGTDGTSIATYRQAVRSGIAYLPRDRRSTGIFPTLSVLDNFAIATIARDIRGLLISRKARFARYAKFRDLLSVVAKDPRAPITALSGGNQQKILIARLLALEPGILILNDPTRGVDVATRRVLYDVFRQLAANGMALVILSSEIEEITFLCHRVLVFRSHELSAEFAGEGMRFDRVIGAMFGRAA